MIKRMSIVSASIALGCIASVAPVLTSIYIAEEDAEGREQDDLQEFATKAVMRAELVSYQALAAIAEMEAARGPPCSPAHIAQLARVIFNYRYVQDAGVYGGGQYSCSPLLGDVRAQHLTMPEPDRRTRDGYLTWYRHKSPLSKARQDIQVGRNGNYVSIDSQSYVDLIDPAQRPIAVFSSEANVLLALSTGADAADMLNAWKHTGSVSSEQWHYAIAHSASLPLGVVVKSPRRSLLGNWSGLLGMWLSIGVVVGGLFGWLSFRKISQQLAFPSTLEWAIARKRIDVCFQPIVRLADGECVGVEALVRWKLNGRNISPEIFVAVAEQNGLIQPLTDLVLDQTVDELSALLLSRPSFYVSINVSSEDLQTRRFLDVLTARLRGTGIRPAQIRIELTERIFLDADTTRQTIAAFRDAGHPVYIDDFGTGYSSLSYLQTFKIDVLKIDKSFIDTIAQDAASSIVAPHIIRMAHELGVEVLAEGVERDAQVDYLVERGVQYGQGWLFAKAMHSKELIAWLGEPRTQREPITQCDDR
ncbi:diguanylate cyclase/phosphodiesterase with PAS/PAC sensor [Paraburkholderia caribensis MBA4]|uniref:cyclic-guanylate-specific phosphodiesterase n=1 Tax=Paraburkholderia caribensis MBA4 TaxID=1323664 RepID=A0A0N7JUL5_9BURK|nr:EAL domain-containing protein [Paraburkholderia caribensis]ALL66749.1 diguanylate cyclase/phosphodiesterase with PAS/PAC sensor [Paraburkholderia caribensis MBA4]